MRCENGYPFQALFGAQGFVDRTGQILLGKYELTRLLGKGGMGEVWAGEHNITGRQVAVKVLSENYLQNQKVVKRFGREARAASAVQHPGIVEILDQDMTPDGVPFLVMEWLRGQSVADRVRDRGRLGESEALAVILPLLDALEAAHQNGVIHRDLKPDNVFLLPADQGKEHVKILDFGISQKADEIDHNLTQEGSVLGTPHYMSPEQARGEAGIDARVDVYATAIMLYECVVGDVPFDAGNYNALLQIILTTPPVPPRNRGATISAPVEQVILAAMEKRREGRPATARAFYDLLVAATQQPEDAVLNPETLEFGAPPSSAPPQGLPSLGEEFASEPPPLTPSSTPPSLDSEFPQGSGDFDSGLPSMTPGPIRRPEPAGFSEPPPDYQTRGDSAGVRLSDAPSPFGSDSYGDSERPYGGDSDSPFGRNSYGDMDSDAPHENGGSGFSDAPPGHSAPPGSSSLPVEPMESLAIDEGARRRPEYEQPPEQRESRTSQSAPRAGRQGSSLNDRPLPSRQVSNSMPPLIRGALPWLVLLAVAALLVFVTRAVFFKEDPKAARRRLLEQRQQQKAQEQ